MSLIPSQQLTYCLNFNSLQTFLSLEGTKSLAIETGCDVNFLPLVSGIGNVARDSEKPDDPLAVYKARRARARTLFSDRELRRDCTRLGISEENGRLTFDPTPAALGLAYLKQTEAPQQTCWEYVESVFSIAFKDGGLVDHSAIADLLGDGYKRNDSLLSEIQGALEEAGIFASPGYLYEGERFHGRQHLPLLRWIVSGRHGSPPV